MRPGLPCLEAPQAYPYTMRRPWREDIGNQVVRHLTPQNKAVAEQCAGLKVEADFLSCTKAMEGGIIGLSYGIGTRDLWSENLSNKHRLPTVLFDCWTPAELSPTLAGLSRNTTGPGGCEGLIEPCYEKPYWSVRSCLGGETVEVEGARFETLQHRLQAISKKQRLSAHVKIKMEGGAEWLALEGLLKDISPELDKIRTLDLTVKMGDEEYVPGHAARWRCTRTSMNRQVGVLRDLLQRFDVLGSTLEARHQAWKLNLEGGGELSPEPCIHTSSGFDPSTFSVSYVHKKVLEVLVET